MWHSGLDGAGDTLTSSLRKQHSLACVDCLVAIRLAWGASTLLDPNGPLRAQQLICVCACGPAHVCVSVRLAACSSSQAQAEAESLPACRRDGCAGECDGHLEHRASETGWRNQCLLFTHSPLVVSCWVCRILCSLRLASSLCSSLGVGTVSTTHWCVLLRWNVQLFAYIVWDSAWWFLKSAGYDRPAYTPSPLHRRRFVWLDVGQCCFSYALCSVSRAHTWPKGQIHKHFTVSMTCFDLFQLYHLICSKHHLHSLLSLYALQSEQYRCVCARLLTLCSAVWLCHHLLLLARFSTLFCPPFVWCPLWRSWVSCDKGLTAKEVACRIMVEEPVKSLINERKH